MNEKKQPRLFRVLDEPLDYFAQAESGGSDVPYRENHHRYGIAGRIRLCRRQRYGGWQLDRLGRCRSDLWLSLPSMVQGAKELMSFAHET